MQANKRINLNHSIRTQILDAVSKANNIVILIHVNPDGDAIGSALALYNHFNNLKKKVWIVAPNNFPDFLKWMPGARKIINFEKSKKDAEAVIDEAEIIISADFSSVGRIEALKSIFFNKSCLKINIDHHLNPEPNWDIILNDTSASSTAELIYYVFFDENPDLLNKDIATCIFVGIMTDTGSFSYACNHSYTFSIIAKLIEHRIIPEKIHRLVYDTFSESRMRLLGHSLGQRMTVLPDLQTAYIKLYKEDLKQYKYVTGDTEGIVNYPLSIKGIGISALFIEKRDIIKISFRSKGDHPVNELAKKEFNGGGHRNAAGGHFRNSNIDAVTEHFEKILPHYFNNRFTS